MIYIPEIDGLRAISILSVILFHAGVPGFGGGFIGVDIFFVISGYLITSLIVSEDAGKTFRFLNFYNRRARRILPALLSVLGLSLPLAFYLLPPKEFSDFLGASLSTVFFVSNIYLWKSNGYFDSVSEQNPLIHTWSLAVEEQYYILYPPFLIFALRHARHRAFAIVASAALISLVLAGWGSVHKPIPAFYLLPTRAWEILVGGLIPLLAQRVDLGRLPRPARELAGLLGLCLILGSITAFDPSIPHPGYRTILPVAGAALALAFSTADTSAGRLLSARPLAGLGLISYSAYLWHQPLLAFSRYADPVGAASMPIALGVSAATLGIAALSYRYIESPFRRRPGLPPRVVWTALAVPMLAIATVCLVLRWQNAGPYLNHEQQLALQRLAPPPDKTDWTRCLSHGGVERDYINEPCAEGALDATDTIGLIGDSHAETLHYPLGRLAETRGRRVVLYAGGSCPPIIDPSFANSCFDFQRAGIQRLIDRYKVKTVILSAEWSEYIEATPYDNGAGTVINGSGLFGPAYGTGPERRAFVAGLFRQTIDDLLQRNITVAVVGPHPNPAVNIPNILLSHLRFRPLAEFSDDTASIRYDTFNSRSRSFDGMMAAYGTNPNVIVIRLDHFFCSDKVRCRFYDKGEPLIRDTKHLSPIGAQRVAHLIDGIVFDGQVSRPIPPTH